jgi:peptide-methionine (R)-S-oxide reductase
MAKIEKSKAEWQAQLTPEQFHVTREHGTERAFTGPHQEEKRDGMFKCVCCGNDLFETNSKFDSGTGWPSFFKATGEGSVSEHTDRKFFMTRTEIRCADCEAHLGHVFPDGPQPTGLRYCMNGHALTFKPDSEA